MAAVLVRACELCTAGAPWPAVRHRCYRGSVAGSVAVSWKLWRNWTAGVYAHLVDRYIVLTCFAAGRLEATGVPGRRIVVKPNFVRAPARPANGTPAGGYAVYAGLLSKEKGILTLLDAWRELRDVPLKVLGDGPLMAELARRCSKESLPVELLGMRPRAEVLATMAGARFLVVPSECFEGLPLVMVEALACGLPVVASISVVSIIMSLIFRDELKGNKV